MSIGDKIEEIRKKPEYIRMRYVWLCVFLSMIFVIAIWIFSVQVTLNERKDLPVESNPFNSEVLDQFNQQKNSLKNTGETLKNSLSQPPTGNSEDTIPANNIPQ